MDYGFCCFILCSLMRNNLGLVVNLQFVIVNEVIVVQNISVGYYFVDFINIIKLKVFFGDMIGWYSSDLFGKIGFVEEIMEE